MPEQGGAFAEAARAREEQLVQRLATSVAADQDFQAVLRAACQHNVQSRQRLDALEAEIRQAAATWPALNTLAGARQFQAYLTGKTRQIHQIVADAASDSQQRAAQVQALTGRYPIGEGKQILGGPKKSPTPTPSPSREPPAYDPADAADLLKKIDDWKREHDAAQLARSEVVREYGKIIIEAGKFGGQVDESTGDIIWPDGTKTSMRPPD